MRKLLKAFIVTLLAYLLHVCLMPYLQIGIIMANVMIANIAVLTVSYGKKYAFGAGAVTGILMECMMASVNGLYVIAYPVLATLFAQLFADMSDRKREARRLANRKHTKSGGVDQTPEDWPAPVRILLNAAAMTAAMEIILVTYNYLVGMDFTFIKVTWILLDVLYTTAVTAIIMYPERLFLGMYARKKSKVSMRKEESDA